MISALRLCPKCGLEIPADAPEGGCPGCLLESGLNLLAEEVVAPQERDDPGSVDEPARAAAKSERVAQLAGEFGDYELLEEIGRGGQGVVYLARQKSLNRTVALKVISLGQWASRADLKRFRREALAAASLDHPNIVPIYEVGEHDGSCYFSMKFVEGGQLDEVAGRTPISIPQAAKVMAKLARTVHYAHEHGILHRDIKPGNILLDTNGEPHLTDFGLARLVEADSNDTRTREAMGTPSYMAPEQALGHNDELTSATDVYGLGAVLYQLLTGRPPFAAETMYGTIRLLLQTEPREPRLLNRKMDRDLSKICLKSLEKEPSHRYSSALALAEDLEHWLKHEPIQAKRTGFVTHGRKWVQRNPAIAALVASLVALAAAVGWNIWKSDLFRPQPEKSIAVLPFENLSRDPDSAYFAEGVQQEILTRLAGIADLKVISRSSTRQYQNKPRSVGEIAKRLGVANILEGSVQKVGDQVRVNVQLINAQTDSGLWAESYNQTLTDLLEVESDIAKRIAESLQATLTGREEEALAVKPTNNPEAYDAYLRGLAFEARSTYSNDALRKAIDSYERAVQLDPNFALAWAQLSRVDANLYFVRADQTAARREAAKETLERAQKLQPDSPETQLALGYYQYWVLRDYRLAENTFALLRKVLPGSSDVLFALGSVARREGNWDASIAYCEEALAMDPRNMELLSNTAWTYAMLRRFPTALKLYNRALDIMPNDPDLITAEASVYQAEGDLQKAANLLLEINAQSPIQPFITKITQLRLERNYGEAIRLLQTRQTQFQFASEIDKGTNQVLLAFTRYLAGDSAGAKATAAQAHNTLEPLCRNQSDNSFFAQQLSLANVALGEKQAALSEAERAITLLPSANDPISGPTREEVLALVQMISGETSRPIATLTRLLGTPYISWLYGPMPATPALLRLDPIWDPLRADPGFQKLCEEKQP